MDAQYYRIIAASNTDNATNASAACETKAAKKRQPKNEFRIS
jgi:hypothetical protein